jgi:hypothetical protein
MKSIFAHCVHKLKFAGLKAFHFCFDIYLTKNTQANDPVRKKNNGNQVINLTKFVNIMSFNAISSYGHHNKKRPPTRALKMDTGRNDGLTVSSSHDNCNCFVSNNPGSSSRHFDNTLKVLEKKRNLNRKATNLCSIREEPPSLLDLEFDIAERLHELRESSSGTLSRLDSADDGIIYFMSRDRNGSTNLKMRFVNSLSNLSTMIRNGINKINDNGKSILNLPSC